MSGALLALPFGLAIGLLLALVGGGGSLLAVPVLVYLLGEPVKDATTESLLVVGTAAPVGAADHAQIGRVELRTALTFGAAGAAGALGGTALNRLVGGRSILLAFALLLLVAAIAMLRHAPESPTRGSKPSFVRVAKEALGIVRRHLAPDGAVYLFWGARHTEPGRARDLADQLSERMRLAEFSVNQVLVKDLRPVPAVCVIGRP